MPTHIIANQSIIDSTHSRVLVEACSGSFFEQGPRRLTRKGPPWRLTLYTRMTTIVVMNIGTLIPNDDYSRHGHYRAVSALYPAAT